MVIRVPAILLLACVASAAQAGKNDPTWNPPARFDFQYPGEVRDEYLPQPEVFKKCRDLHRKAGTRDPKTDVRGCAQPFKDYCLMYIVNEPFNGATPEAIKRHEMGHCNGWPSHHPD